MKVVMFAITLGAVVAATTAAHAETRTPLREETAVEDQARLELTVRESAGELVVDLAAGDTGTRDVGDIADGITPDAGIRAVTVVIQPSPSTLRIFYKAKTDFLEIPSATGGFAYEIPVPDGDEEAWFEYVIEARDETTRTTIATSGYIRIKKLNSGG